MALLPNIGVQAFISSAKNKMQYFLSGFAGRGWKIWEWTNDRYKLEIDDLTVRRTMTVYELIISKIRSIVGSMAITQAHGKIKSVDDKTETKNYLITLEDEINSFMAGDFIRMQEFTSRGQRSYWVRVSEIRGNIIIIPKSEFDEEQGIPEIGDEIVQFGNEHDTARQSAIYLHADETGQPAIDVMFGINSKSFDGKVKLRLGAGLPGASDNFKGLYAENGMLKFTNDKGEVTSQIWPDGTAELGSGGVKINPDKSGYIGGENGLSWHWDEKKSRFVCELGANAILQWKNLSDEVKENLKGESGKDGVPGPAGKDGVIYYTWIRYADDEEGKGMSNNPVGKKYMGLAYNKTTPAESNNASDYSWSRFRGEDGTDGVAGPKGENGETFYTWIAYSDNANGSNMYQKPTDKTKYIGIAVNKTTPEESKNPADYVWSLFRGEDSNLLPWVEDWNNNTIRTGSDFFISPKIFSGTRNTENQALNGIALGRDVVTVGNKKKTGLFGIKNGDIVFSLDAATGNAEFTGKVKATAGEFSGYLKTPFVNISTWPKNLNLETGFNFFGSGENTPIVYLPSATDYQGVNCTIYVPSIAVRVANWVEVRIADDGFFRYAYSPWNGPYIKGIRVVGFLLELVALNYGDSVNWYIKNYSEIKDDTFTFIMD